MFAQKIEKELNKISSRPLPINMDGANAAILSDMGFDWRIVVGFFLIGRISGIIAHCNEEQQSEDGIQRLSPDEEVYLEKK
jgi:citryl-CoA lyase